MAKDVNKVRIKLKAYEHEILDSSAATIVDALEREGASFSGPIPLPTKKEIVTILRSPHKYKDSREKDDAKKEEIGELSREEKQKLINSLEKQMKLAAKNMEFEQAAAIRDRVIALKKELLLSRLPEVSLDLGDEV